MSLRNRAAAAAAVSLIAIMMTGAAFAQEKTQKPPLHGSHWMAITGKPLAATAGARMFERGGNAVDAACAMLAATSTMWDVLSWGGETQALVYNPETGRIIAINGLGVAPTGATVDFYKRKGLKYPPEYGPLAAVTPGTPGALITMLAEFGRLSLAEVLAPSISLADGYAIDAETADRIEAEKERIKEWPYSKAVMLPHAGEAREAPRAGEIFRQADLAATLRSLVEAEATALAAGKSRKEALMAAYDRFYRGDIADEFVRGVAGTGRLDHERRPRPLARRVRGAGAHELPRHRRLQARPLDAGPGDAAGAQHPRELRPQGDGLQQCELHPHRLPGDEPRLRRPGLLLRRPVLPAGGADQGPAVQGLREAARRAGQPADERPGDRARRSVSAPGRDESVPRAAAEARSEHADVRCRALRRGDGPGHRLVPARHDERDSRGQGRLAGLDDALRRLAARGHRRQDRRRREPARADRS